MRRRLKNRMPPLPRSLIAQWVVLWMRSPGAGRRRQGAEWRFHNPWGKGGWPVTPPVLPFKQTKALNDCTLSSIQKRCFLFVIRHVQGCPYEGWCGRDQPGHHKSQWRAEDSPSRVLSLPPQTPVWVGGCGTVPHICFWDRSCGLFTFSHRITEWFRRNLWRPSSPASLLEQVLSRNQELKPQFHSFHRFFSPLCPHST